MTLGTEIWQAMALQAAGRHKGTLGRHKGTLVNVTKLVHKTFALNGL